MNEFASLPVTIDTTPSGDVDVLKRAAMTQFPQAEELRVSSTFRLGNSGSRVYRARVRMDGGLWSRPYFAKIGSAEKIAHEHNAYQRYVAGTISQAALAWMSSDRSVSCICCSYVGHKSNFLPAPLADYLDEGTSVKRLCEAVKLLYREVFSPWREAAYDSEIVWADAYAWYLRWDRTEPFVRAYFGESALQQKSYTLFGQRFVSPLACVRRLSVEQTSSKIKVRPVHGDLHQRNIILDQINDVLVPWIIDFGWTRPFHSMVDYALLEASLKVFYFSRFISEERLVVLHDMLDAGSVGHITRPAERALVELILTIRRFAREDAASPESWLEEYYRSSLLITLGLISVPTCPCRSAWLVSSWLATRLSGKR